MIKLHRLVSFRLESIPTLLSGVVMFAVGSIAIADGQSEESRLDPNTAILMPADKIVWISASQGVSTGHAYGDRNVGEYGSFVTFPANFVTPVHRHTSAYHGVVISGIVTNPMAADDNDQPVQLGPGSYWFVPAGEAHTTACVSDDPCVYYTHSTEFFDFITDAE